LSIRYLSDEIVLSIPQPNSVPGLFVSKYPADGAEILERCVPEIKSVLAASA